MGNKNITRSKITASVKKKSKSFDKVFVCSFNYFGCLDYDPLFIVLKTITTMAQEIERKFW